MARRKTSRQGSVPAPVAETEALRKARSRVLAFGTPTALAILAASAVFGRSLPA